MNRTAETSARSAVFAERLVLREFSHRVNNELAFAISSLSFAADRCDSSEARDAIVAVQDRLQGFARVHRALQMPDHSTIIDTTAYLHRLCQAISYSKLESMGVHLSLSLCPFHMSSERCWYLGMIIFELITSAAQHAFEQGAGEIELELFPSGMLAECRIVDNGISESDIRREAGLKIVEALARNLHGTIDVEFGPGGFTSVLVFSLDR
jgi:two-component sensor histidine kinase